MKNHLNPFHTYKNKTKGANIAIKSGKCIGYVAFVYGIYKLLSGKEPDDPNLESSDEKDEEQNPARNFGFNLNVKF